MEKTEKTPRNRNFEKKLNKGKNFARIGQREIIALFDDVYCDCKMKDTDRNYKLRQSTYNY